MTRSHPTRTKKPDSSRPPQVLEWEFAVGPPRRSWRWYGIVLAIGLGLAGLFYLSLRNGWSAALGMLLWTCIVIAAALAPTRNYRVELNRNLLTIRDVKRGRAIIDRNLAEFATYKLIVLPADRLNPLQRKLILRPRNGALPVEIVLTGDDQLDQQFIDRVTAVVQGAPNIAPTLLERFGSLAERWVGWR